MDNSKGVHGKYILSKADGSEVDPNACYLVLRLDTDEHARAAARVYAVNAGGRFGHDIHECLDELEREPFDSFFGISAVWRHGGDWHARDAAALKDGVDDGPQ